MVSPNYGNYNNMARGIGGDMSFEDFFEYQRAKYGRSDEDMNNRQQRRQQPQQQQAPQQPQTQWYFNNNDAVIVTQGKYEGLYGVVTQRLSDQQGNPGYRVKFTYDNGETEELQFVEAALAIDDQAAVPEDKPQGSEPIDDPPHNQHQQQEQPEGSLDEFVNERDEFIKVLTMVQFELGQLRRENAAHAKRQEELIRKHLGQISVQVHYDNDHPQLVEEESDDTGDATGTDTGRGDDTRGGADTGDSDESSDESPEPGDDQSGEPDSAEGSDDSETGA